MVNPAFVTHFLQEGLVVDSVKALSYVCIQYVLRFGLNGVYNLLDGVMATPARSESVAIRFKFRLELWFDGQFNQCLQTSISKCWDSKWSLFVCPRLGYSDSSGR